MLSFFIGKVFHCESPIFLLKKNEADKAANVMMKLRSESLLTEEIKNDIEDYKILIQESESSSGFNIFGVAILKIVLFKLASVATFNLILNIYLFDSFPKIRDEDKFDIFALILISFKFVYGLYGFRYMIRHRMFFLSFSCILSAIALICIFIDKLFELGNKELLFLCVAMLLQVSSVSISGIADIMHVEAFDLRSKPLAIAISCAFEFVLHLISIGLFFNAGYQPMLVPTVIGISGFFMLVVFFISMTVPDTSGLSLIDARAKY